MKLQFTASNTISSRLIRWALGEPVSHVAIEFPDGLVVHSKLLTGVTLEWTSEFHSKNKVIYTVNYPIHWRVRKDLLKFVLDLHAKASYDYKGLLYFAWCALKYKLFKIPYPPTITWQNANQFLCTELAVKFIDSPIPHNKFITPYQLYKELTDGRL
jgi:hypothetical protein